MNPPGITNGNGSKTTIDFLVRAMALVTLPGLLGAVFWWGGVTQRSEQADRRHDVDIAALHAAMKEREDEWFALYNRVGELEAEIGLRVMVDTSFHERFERLIEAVRDIQRVLADGRPQPAPRDFPLEFNQLDEVPPQRRRPPVMVE